MLIKTPLVYAEFEQDLYQTSADKTRNICILSTFMGDAGSSSVPPTTTQSPLIPIVTIPAPTTIKSDTPILDAAGPEDTAPEITPEQTETKAGPEIWIFLLLAFVFSSAWTAYKRQKI